MGTVGVKRRNEGGALPTGLVLCDVDEVSPTSLLGWFEFDEETGGSLRVFGHLSPHVIGPDGKGWAGAIRASLTFAPGQAPGRASRSERMTFLDARLATQWNGSPFIDRRHIVEEELFYFDHVLLGDHGAEGMNALVTGIGLSTEVTGHWAPGNPADHSGGFGKPHTITLPPVDPISLPQGRGDLTLRWHESQVLGGDVEVTQEPVWELVPTEPLTIDEVSREFVWPLLSLVTIATGWLDSVRWVRLVGGPEGDRWTGRLFSTKWPPLDPYEGREPELHHLIPIADALEIWPTALERWAALVRSDERAYLVAQSLTQGGTILEAFMAMIGAVEQWHDVSRSTGRMSRSAFRRLKHRIREHVAADEWAVIEDRIASAYKFSLREKLFDLCQTIGWPLGDVTLWLPDFVDRCVTYRNGMTHGWTAERPFTPHELKWATMMLRQILSCDVLIALGGDPEQLGQWLFAFRHSHHLIDGHHNPFIADAGSSEGSPADKEADPGDTSAAR